jgi:hypothetical protein
MSGACLNRWCGKDNDSFQAAESVLLQIIGRSRNLASMDPSLLKDLIGRGQPLRIETASGQAFEVRHRDFIAFSPRQTLLLIWFEENEEEHFALVPLLTVTAAVTRA